MEQRGCRAVGFQQVADVPDIDRVPVALRQRKLRAEPPLAPELGPAGTGAVLLRRGADVVVARPAEALAFRPAVQGGEHASQRGVVAARLELQEVQEQIRLGAGGPMSEWLGNGAAVRPQGSEAVGLGSEGGGESSLVHLQENATPLEGRAVAAVDATAAD